ncbi:MAG TPA: 2OG-Fe(II) oxygenase [Burkholderiaceae bacterium]|nr:2OG-Fe(II) oxygenase [Burkholderiaceae bacterium]
MRLDQLPSELQAWLRTMHELESTRDAVLQALLAAKYDANYAGAVVDNAWRELSGQTAPPSQVNATPTGGQSAPAARGNGGSSMPLSTQLAEMPNSLETLDREVEMLFVIESPRVVLFGNLLSHDECDSLVGLSRDKLQRSSVVNASTGAYDFHPHRTSSGTYFTRGENELLQRIERRIADLVDCPIDQGEPIQVLHYEPGGEYKPHYDYFDPAHPGNNEVLAQGGQRIATLIMYLNDVTRGGSTVFPEIGLDVLPRKGHAVYFAYCDEAGALDVRTLHGGSPVASGEKWIATKWFRQRAYEGTGA